MAKINRITGNVDAFAKDALGTERTVFGGVTQSDDLNDQINDEFKRGWGIVGPSEFPKIQDFNAVGFATSMMSAYLYQMGIAEWHGAQQYQIRSVVSAPDGIYICKTANHTSATSPKDDPSNWDALVAQSFGTKTSVTVSQKVITDELHARLPRTDVLGFTGTSTTAVMSQKIVTDELALRLAQSNIKQVTGTSTTDVMSQDAVTGQLFGVGQSVQDVKSSRSRGTIYTNSTGRTIFVSITTGQGGELETSADGVTWVSSGQSGNSGDVENAYCVVPNGHVYRLTSSGAIVYWSELR